MKKFIFLFILLVFVLNNTNAQNIWENPNSPVYSYLNRMAQKGLIEFNDLIKPVNRNQIQTALIVLSTKKELLTLVESNELEFYLQEYRPVFKNDSTIHLLKNDSNNRWRFFNIVHSDFELHADPLIGINTYSSNSKSTNILSSGFELWGAIGKNKNWGYQVYYRDYTEKGYLISNSTDASPLPGRILVDLLLV